jgi:hypothetical protein
LEENVLGFLRKETPTAAGSNELNLLMRLINIEKLIILKKPRYTPLKIVQI